MNPFADIIKAFNAEHGVYATVDINQHGPPKILLARRNDVVVRDLEGEVDIITVLEDMLKELKGDDVDAD